MKLRSFAYLCKEGTKSIFRHKLMSLASVGVLTACLLLIGASVLLTVNINTLVGSAEKENEIIAFLDDFTPAKTKAETEKIRTEIGKLTNIRTITYVSKEEALEEEKSRLGDDADLLAGFESDNPYPAHFILTVNQLEKLSDTIKSLESIDHVYKVNSAESVASTLVSVRNAVQTGGAAIFIALVLVSLVIISNTIRLTVFSRRREINIMKMVGATNRFIRTPFMVEGTVVGIVAGLLAFFLLWGGYAYLLSNFNPTAIFSISQYTGFVPAAQILPPMLGGFLAAGILTGLVGSSLSLQRHLNV